MAKKSKYYVRPDGLHEAIRVINGKRVAFRGATDGEVEKKMIEYKQKDERGILFKDVATQYKDACFPLLAKNTLKGYNPAFRRAVEAFGDIPIKDIEAPAIKQYLQSFVREQLSRKTVANQKLMISLIFAYAIESLGAIKYNPCSQVAISKKLVKGHREAATVQEEEIIKNGSNTWIFPFFILYTGLRKGEALALKYSDLDWETMEINVCKSVYYENRKAYIKKPKTTAGIRKVPILDVLADKLQHKKSNDYIFSIDGKNILSEKDYRSLYDNYKKETGITATAHQLRHSYATMLYECDVNSKDAQQFLGHASISMTEDIYTHIREERRKSVASTINKTLAEKNKQNTENTQNPL